MQLDSRHHASFYGGEADDSREADAFVVDISVHSSSARDSSNARRDASLDNTRQTVNTRTSILDLTKDDDDDEEEGEDVNKSIMFHDLQQSSFEETSTKKENEGALIKFDLYDFTYSLVNSVCGVEVPKCTAPSCTVPSASCTAPNLRCVPKNCVPKQRLQVGMDIWNLLGCSSAPDEEEMERIWKSTRLHPRDPLQPTRANLLTRMHRIRKMRADRWTGATRYGVTASPMDEFSRNNSVDGRRGTIGKSFTMDGFSPRGVEDPLEEFIGSGLEPIPLQFDGYDSDPEISGPTSSLSRKETNFVSEDDQSACSNDSDEQDYIIYQSVQVCA